MMPLTRDEANILARNLREEVFKFVGQKTLDDTTKESLVKVGDVQRCLTEELKVLVVVTYEADVERRWIKVKPKRYIKPELFSQLLAILHDNFEHVKYVSEGAGDKNAHIRVFLRGDK